MILNPNHKWISVTHDTSSVDQYSQVYCKLDRRLLRDTCLPVRAAADETEGRKHFRRPQQVFVQHLPQPLTSWQMKG